MNRVLSPNEPSSHSLQGDLDILREDPSASTPNSEEVFAFPATSAQRRFWLLDNFQDEGNPALNMPVPLRLRGRLDARALRRALNEVVARHEALRTTFVSNRGELRQLIFPELTLDLPIVRANESEMERLLRDEVEKPFDLVSGPLLRARLVRFNERDHLLLMTVHHIISDGWSNGVLVKDLCAAYRAIVTQGTVELPPLAFQFADFAEWQTERLSDHDFDWQREYWRRQLAGDLPALDLPTDRPRLRSRSNAVGFLSRLLPEELIEAAQTLAATENASPFMLYLAVFEILLHRYTGQTDFLVTSPSANRERLEFESVIGPFVNPLLLRADLRGEPSFRELLARVRSTAVDAFGNQDVPFELLLDEFHTSRLQVNFLYQKVFISKTTLPDGLTMEPLESRGAGTLYELSAAVLEDSYGVRLDLEYDPSLFEAATIERMLGHYQTLLEAAVSNPAQTISDLRLLTDREQEELGLKAISQAKIERLNLRKLLATRVLTRPDAMAVRHGKRELSCAELLARLESARSSDGATSFVSELDQTAVWIAHWRERLQTSPPTIQASDTTRETTAAAAARMFVECTGLQSGERIASFSKPGAAANEEIGAALIADALLVYPTTEVLSAGPAGVLDWLEREKIAVAFMPAVTWNCLRNAFDRKIVRPANLRLIVAAEGEPNEGTFGRVPSDAQRRMVIGHVGTVSLEKKIFPGMDLLRVVDLHSGEPLPIGVTGRLTTFNGIDTGQLARWWPNRSLELLGKLREQVKVRGLRLALREIENAMSRIPGIRHTLVRSIAKEDGRSEWVAFVLPESSRPVLPNDAQLRQLLRGEGLPDELLPQAFARLGGFPLRSMGGHLEMENFRTAPPTNFLRDGGTVRPYIGLQLQLIAIWEDLLAVRPIGIRDNFFELGGNSLLALRMLQRVEAICDKQVLPSALYRNATIEHLAGEMAQDVIRESPALLKINESGAKTPFFYLHGDLFGGGFYSLKLSRALGPDQPFYVLPPYDIRSHSTAPTIEEMAAAHLAALREARPNGPYVIGGFCIGGLVAYELARQIKASGEEVEMLLLIDTAPTARIVRCFRSLGEKGRGWFGWNQQEQLMYFGTWVNWRNRLIGWSEMRFSRQLRTIKRRLSQIFRRMFRAKNQHIRSGPSSQSRFAQIQERDVPSTFVWAAAGYHLARYDSPAALLLSEDIPPDKPFIGQWRQIAPNMAVHQLSGRHLECITAHVDLLAQRIRTCLENGSRDG